MVGPAFRVFLLAVVGLCHVRQRSAAIVVIPAVATAEPAMLYKNTRHGLARPFSVVAIRKFVFSFISSISFSSASLVRATIREVASWGILRAGISPGGVSYEMRSLLKEVLSESLSVSLRGAEVSERSLVMVEPCSNGLAIDCS